MTKSSKGTRKKTNSKSPKQTNPIAVEIIGLCVIALGLFLCACILFEQSLGIVGEYTIDLIKGTFGLFSYPLPVLMIIWGLYIVFTHKYKLDTKKIISVLIILYSVMSLIHISTVSVEPEITYSRYLTNSFDSGVLGRGGGFVAGLAVYLINHLIGYFGSILLYVLLIIIFVLLMTKFSLQHKGQQIRETIESKRKNQQRVRKLHNDYKKVRSFRLYNIPDDTAQHDEDIFKEEYIKPQPVKKTKSKQAQVEETEVITTEPISELKGTGTYKYPPISLLDPPIEKANNNMRNATEKAAILESALESFGINANVSDITCGPSVTRYELTIERGTRVSRITNLTDDIALAMAATGIRIEAPIPGKSAIGIEIANESISMVTFREVIDTPAFQNASSPVSIALGKSITGNTVVADLNKMPHLLIAGATGSGKSVCINCLITSLIFKSSPEDLRMILVDPKQVELNTYADIPHLLYPLVTDAKKAAGVLNGAVLEMEKRYKQMQEKGVRDINKYNQVALKNGEPTMPRLVIVIDEFADLMMVAPADVENSVVRLAQLARAAGIYLVLATQRPSANVITGIIKANIPSRIAFAVASSLDSRIILDANGAERLLGKGDMLYHPNGDPKPTRIQGAYLSDSEIERVVSFIKANTNFVNEYDTTHIDTATTSDISSSETKENEADKEYEQAVSIVVDYQQASISLLQRKMKIGYAKAGRFIDQMEEAGYISQSQGSKPREVLLTRTQFNEIFNNEE